MKYDIVIEVAGNPIRMVGIDADDELEAQNSALVQARAMIRLVSVDERG